MQPIQVARLPAQPLIHERGQGVGFAIPGQIAQPGGISWRLPVAGREGNHVAAFRRKFIQAALQAQNLQRGRAVQRVGLPGREQQLTGQAQFKGVLLRRAHLGQ